MPPQTEDKAASEDAGSSIREILRVVFILILSVAITGCALGGDSNTPTAVIESSRPVVTLSHPTGNEPLDAQAEINVQSTSVDVAGIARVELLIDGQVIWRDANPQPEPNTPYIVLQPWKPDTPGSYVLQVRAYTPAGVVGETEPVVIRVQEAAAAAVVPTQTPTSIPPTDPPQPEPTPTAPATATPMRPTNTPAATATPRFTPTATPTPGRFRPTGFEPDGRFAEIWQSLGAGRSRLGYPTEPPVDDRDYARQYFEKGLMYWWDSPADEDVIWVIDTPADDLNSGKTSNRYIDSWDGGEEVTCQAALANGNLGPLRGFGKQWCDRPELQSRLGNPISPEAGSSGSPPYGQVQFFQGGVMLMNPINQEIYVIFDQGDWQRFGS